MADRVEIPVDLALSQTSVDKLRSELRQQLQKELTGLATDLGKRTGASVTGRQTLEGTEGRKFEATGKISGQSEDINTDIFSVRIREIRQKVAKELSEEGRRLREFKDRIKFQEPEIQREEIQKFVATFGDINNELNSRLGKINKRLEAEAKKVKRELDNQPNPQLERFNKFKTDIKFQDPKTQKEEIQQFVASFGDINNELTHRLNRINKSMENEVNRGKRQLEIEERKAINAQRQAAKERRLNFQNTVLVGASSAIGIFGTAGFAALNVGFAAMSGGPVGAGIAAISSTIGLIVQGLEEAAKVSKQAATSMGAISNQFKSAEAKSKGFDAFFDIGIQGIQAASEKRRREILQGKTQATFGEGLELAQRGMSRGFDRTMTERPDSTWMYGGPVGSFFVKSAQEILKIGKIAEGTRLEFAQSALLNAQRAMAGNMPGMDADPYAMYLRMQNAAMTVNSEEQRWQQEALAELRKLVKAEDDKAKIIKDKTINKDTMTDMILRGGANAW